MFREIKNVSPQMVKAARRLNEGGLLVVYCDHGTIRCETERGTDPYVWRKGQWRRMIMR